VPICAAPREKLNSLPGFPNIIQCCHNSPILGGKFAKASKLCSEHKDLEQSQATVTTVTVPSIAFSELTEQTTGKFPDNDDEIVLTECKKEVNRYHTQTCRYIGCCKAMWCCGEFYGNVYV